MNLSELYDVFVRIDKEFRKQNPTNSCICTDTRACKAGAMFFALKGENFNGNTFAEKALQLGAAAVIIDQPDYAVQDERCVLVPNVLNALQQLAQMHRIAWGKPVIAITGTNGKTTTKELTASVLTQKYNVLYTQGNLNNHIGVPLTLLQLTDQHELAIIEMGASHPGDITELVNIACPNVGLITNVGMAHLQGFGSFEGVKKTKAELYDFLRQNNGAIFLNNDNQHLRQMANKLPAHTYSLKNNPAEVQGEVMNCRHFLQMKAVVDGQELSLNTQLAGTYNAENVLAAITVGKAFGLSLEQLKKGIEDYIPTNNRSMWMDTGRNQLIVDAYNANPTSMEAAIENFYLMNLNQPVLILGDMLELGEHTRDEHARIVQLLKEKGFENVILVGKAFSELKAEYPTYTTVDELYEYLANNPMHQQHILLKGSRGIRLEKLIHLL